ncbi:MAG: peroxiredoxin family protein [Planctomycetota bacterium]
MQKHTTAVVQALLAASLLLAPGLTAQGGSTGPETFSAIQEEFEAANKDWMTSYREASKSGASKDEMSKLMAARPNAKDYVARVRAIVRADASSDDAGAAAAWLISRGRVTGADLGFALDVLGEHHMGGAHVQSVMGVLSRNPGPAVTVFLAKVAAGAEGDDLAMALMTSAEQLKSAAGTARTLAAGSDEDLERYAGFYGAEAVDVLRAADADALEQRAAKLFDRLVADEALSAVAYRRKTVGEAAASALFELRHLTIGKVAPDIVGEDLDGTPMKLSDYRGKVVVLDFWGDW